MDHRHRHWSDFWSYCRYVDLLVLLLAIGQGSQTRQIPPNYVVERVTAHRKPPDVRICRLSIQSRCRDSTAFHFHPTLPRMLGPTLIGDQVVQVREPGEKRLLTPSGMMEAFHREQLPVDGVVGLIQQRCWSLASAGLRAPHTSPPSCPGTSWRTRSPLASPAVWRRGRQSGGAAGPVPTPASFCAGDTGATGRGTARVSALRTGARCADRVCFGSLLSAWRRQ